ncbi:MAG: carboxylating nicotinate-nucleotide diphosphorylase [Acidobacteriota bacterium]
MDDDALEQLERFLAEDLGRGDITSEALIPVEARAAGRVCSGGEAVLAGLEEAQALAGILRLDAGALARDGDEIDAGRTVLEISGNARAVLGVERTLLNVMSHLSGIATATRQAVRAVRAAHTGALAAQPPAIAATRKTLPGLRRLQKKAVVLGGGVPHRFDLSDAVLVKDNHLAVFGEVDAAVRRLRERLGDIPLEIEVESLEDALRAAEHGADTLLLDNLDPAAIIAVVDALRSAGLRDALSLEASGGITLASVARYADTGVDVISMGMLTSSAPRIDFSMHFDA